MIKRIGFTIVGTCLVALCLTTLSFAQSEEELLLDSSYELINYLIELEELASLETVSTQGSLGGTQCKEYSYKSNLPEVSAPGENTNKTQAQTNALTNCKTKWLAQMATCFSEMNVERMKCNSAEECVQASLEKPHGPACKIVGPPTQQGEPPVYTYTAKGGPIKCSYSCREKPTEIS